MDKKTIAIFAIQGFANNIDLKSDFKIKINKFWYDYIEITFTKDCNPILKNMLLEFITDISNILKVPINISEEEI